MIWITSRRLHEAARPLHKAKRAVTSPCPEGTLHRAKFCFISKQKSTALAVLFLLEATPGFEPGNKGFADLCLTTWLCRLMNQPFPHSVDRTLKTTFILILYSLRNTYLLKYGYDNTLRTRSGADYGARTRHLDLGKVALYQMS